MSRPAKLPRTVILLGWVSFFADVSGEMTYPLLPLFVVGVLHASATSLGWIEGVAQAIVALLAAWAGWRSDRFRRRTPYIRWGYGLPVLGKALLAFATNWPVVLVGRTVDRFGKGMRGSPRDALIAEAVDADQRGRAFGLHRAMDTAGAMTGVLLAAAVIWVFTGSKGDGASPDQASAFRLAFAISAALGLAALALTFLVKDPSEKQPAPDSEKAVPPSPPLPLRSALDLPKSYWLVFAVLLIFALANSSDAFVLLRAGDVGLSPLAVILAYALFNLVYTAVSYPAGILSDRIGRWKVIGAGWAIYAACYAGFALTTGAGGIWPLMALYGVYMALTEGVGKALLSDHLPRDRRGTGLGLFYLASGITTLTSSVVAGLLWDRVGHQAPFYLGAAAAVVALAMIPLASRKPAGPTPAQPVSSP